MFLEVKNEAKKICILYISILFFNQKLEKETLKYSSYATSNQNDTNNKKNVAVSSSKVFFIFIFNMIIIIIIFEKSYSINILINKIHINFAVYKNININKNIEKKFNFYTNIYKT